MNAKGLNKALHFQAQLFAPRSATSPRCQSTRQPQHRGLSPLAWSLPEKSPAFHNHLLSFRQHHALFYKASEKVITAHSSNMAPLIPTVFCALVASAGANAVVLRSWTDANLLANITVARLTLDEKIGILTGVGLLSSRCVGDTHPVPRLGIPSICFQDGPAGVRTTKGVTGFPTGINAASTFSRRLMRARGVAMGEEFRGKGVNVFLGPAMDIMRNPKAGRGWESFGPDPYLTGEGAYETIVGVQSVGVQACAKHFAANNQEHGRYDTSSNLDDRTMHEVHAYPFFRSIDAGVSAVMCAYNPVNGTSACQNSNLLGDSGILRKAGFNGYVVSDWGATHNSSAVNANAGLEIEQPGDWIEIGGGVYNSSVTGLKDSVERGKVSQQRLSQMVMRVLAAWYRLGQDSGFPAPNFDAQNSNGSGPLNLNVSVRSDAHTALSREIASASTVLLKNTRGSMGGGEGLEKATATRGLPVSMSHVKNMAVVGLDANMPETVCGDVNACIDGTITTGWGSGANSIEFLVPPIDALRVHVGTSAKIVQAPSNDIAAAVAAARNKDLAFVFVNANSGEAIDIMPANWTLSDRENLDLWFNGNELIESVAAVCNNTIVVVHSTGPVRMPWAEHLNISAIVYAGLPGEQSGPGLVDVLYGKYNPRGRLPFSFSDDESAYGTEIVYNGSSPVIDYKEKLLLDYRYMDAHNIIPRYEFGFGLSYTTFEYSALSVSTATSRDGQRSLTVRFSVKNVGEVDGTEIAQVYLGYPESAGEPMSVLRGFEEVELGVGQSGQVEVVLGHRELSIWDVESQAWVVPNGTFSVRVGASVKDIRLTGMSTL